MLTRQKASLQQLFLRLISSFGVHRQEFLQKIPQSSKILEIGPFYSPVCRGKNVSYFDILSQKELIKRAVQHGAQNSIKDIPKINYVSPEGNLRVVKKKFDVVISSHVIEHQLDLISHLKDVASLLNRHGHYYILIPDKRYCFDHYIPVSTIADVLSAHNEKLRAHSLKSVIEHRALTTHNDSWKHWFGIHGTLEGNEERIAQAISEYKSSQGKNIDVHSWYFTPDSFANIVSQLNALKIIQLSIDRIYPTNFGELEFFVILRKNL